MSDTPNTTILVAEGHGALANVMSLVLERAGFSVEVASNGQEALEKAKVTTFDMVVTDDQMPFMTGKRLCRRLRDDERYAQTPIIFLTRKPDTKQLEDEFGVSKVISKPFGRRMLLGAVETALPATS